MFVGYQAVGTLGRLIVDGAKKVRILGEKRDVNAKIAQINGVSAHADKNELFGWLKKFKTPPGRIFVVHGEPQSATAFADFVRYKHNDMDDLEKVLDKIPESSPKFIE